jgi:hypothetical protein
VCQAKICHELLVAGSFFQGTEVFTLYVLDQRFGQAGSSVLVFITNYCRDLLETSPPSRPASPLSGYEYVSSTLGSHHHGLENSDFGNRSGQRIQRLLIEVLPRLLRVRFDVV